MICFPHPLCRGPGAMAALILLAGCVSTPPPVDFEPAVSIENVRERYPLNEQTSVLRIENLYGEINVRTQPPGAIGVVASIQVYGADGPRPDFEFRDEDGQARLRVHYADDRPRHRGRPGRVDLAVFVPAVKHLELVGADDRIQLKRYPGNVSARTRAGRILVSALGNLDLASDTGEIRAILPQPGSAGTSRIAGSSLVEVLFPVDADLQLEVRASAAIVAEMGVELINTASEPLHLSSRLGDGGGSLQISGREVYLRPFHGGE